MGNTQRKDYDTTENPTVINPDWMSSIPDTKSLIELSIPGTNCSLCFYGGNAFQCQSWSLLTQYEAGIRFADMHLRHYYDTLRIYYGNKYQQEFFHIALRSTVRFLQQHPKETVLMRIKEECQSAGTKQTFNAIVAHYIEHVGMSWFWTSSAIPSLGQVRGKIVILQDYEGPVMGIPYKNLSVAEDCSVPTVFDIGWKWANTVGNLIEAQNLAYEKMFVTFSSGASMGAYPYTVANQINRHLYSLLESRKNQKTRWGIIAMDFPGAEMVQLIIHSN
ncbi:uncharacterized protein LOC115093286 [Rhinatrema bivittatum]|uniref:uncharacterized protein LOC115093286 n=1 Tax=Rhinatrema bivittatum TaxID=194408 RepID=UPI001128990B|nr:uncharacterized protein LOC115093286 [Rhinatrema bivittatum]